MEEQYRREREEMQVAFARQTKVLRAILCKGENFRRQGKQTLDFYIPIDSTLHSEQLFEGEGMSKMYHIRVLIGWKLTKNRVT